ncbi:SDR family oxidoreductase [Marinilongibacter aquaticus]|uniref:SDR family NAD(P)-dependent oxidoreductase n=1 Tax=Marinilongibacter aquaticus TaxID=2975157 RepID=UPI0021BD5778|nr:SDR family oxidoreductase [Marinilongibacter aquaticus]UBM59956.1 SDR family oxidoreductase [Marinilongibacter aquaticus]
MNFTGKTALITGAGQGIGFEIVNQLCAHGATVVFNDIDKEVGQTALKRLSEYAGQVEFVAGDSGDLALIDKMIERAIARFGKVDMAIANAGITTFGPFLTYDVQKFEQLMRVNLQGTFFLCQKVANQIIKQKTRGKLLLVSSTTSLRSHPDLEAYGMTKAGIRFLAEALSVQLAPKNILVNCVTPGATATERTVSVSDYEEGWAKLIPNGRVAKTIDIANAALFLLSDLADDINGQNIVVDGGWSGTGPMPDSI